MSRVMEYPAELYDNYNELGEDLLFLEAMMSASQAGYQFSGKYCMESGLDRLLDYIVKHTEEIQILSRFLCVGTAQQAPGVRPVGTVGAADPHL